LNARRGFAAALVVVAVWTLAIKFVWPILAAARAGEPLRSHVMWDFWWVAHLVLARQLVRPGPFARPFALAVAWCEIGIVTAKFALFLGAPVWDAWRTNWFVNKCAVLGLFVALAWHLHATAAGRAFRGTR
jgi:hypothetical protein